MCSVTPPAPFQKIQMPEGRAGKEWCREENQDAARKE
jgi:hypothetical protein